MGILNALFQLVIQLVSVAIGLLPLVVVVAVVVLALGEYDRRKGPPSP